MMQFIENWIETAGQTLSFAAGSAVASPLLFAGAALFGLLLVWVKRRVLNRSQRRAVAGHTAGWDEAAVVAERPAELGVGTQGVLIMRPANRPLRIGILCLIFFGGGAVFYGLVPMQAPGRPDFRDWAILFVLAVFGLCAIYIIWMASWRIVLTGTTIRSRAALRPDRDYSIAALRQVTPIGSWERGIVLHFNDNRTLRVTAMMSGFATLLDRVSVVNPELPLVVRAIRGKRDRRD